MKALLTAALIVTGPLAMSGAALAEQQAKPSVSNYLNEGYEVLHALISPPFLQFILKKDKTLVYCTVQVQSGETSSCRTIT